MLWLCVHQLRDLVSFEYLTLDVFPEFDLVLFILLILCSQVLVESPQQLKTLPEPVSESAQLNDRSRLWHTDRKTFILDHQVAQDIITLAL